MTAFTPWSGFLGGALIGLSSVLLLAMDGRIAGVSGILGGALAPRKGDLAWRVLFLLGLPAGALLYQSLAGRLLTVRIEAGWPMALVAGLLVGFGTRLGSGCTSGHGICGLARRSKRSLAATAVFMGVGIATVYVLRHVLGG